MKIESYTYDGDAMKRVYENEKWTVGVKNWKSDSDITMINNLERHNKTDELFVLLCGECTLVYGYEEDGRIVFRGVKMQPNTLYNIPCTLWHNAIMSRDAKIIVIEDVSTGMENSDILMLDEEQTAIVRGLAI